MLGFGAFSGGKADGPQYEMEVNKGSINMGSFEKAANERWANGYRLAHVFMQEENTIAVWEKRS